MEISEEGSVEKTANTKKRVSFSVMREQNILPHREMANILFSTLSGFSLAKGFFVPYSVVADRMEI